jgi:AcrR family transcriptional regulator
VQRTGVPVATIHHYRRLGLLPPAEEASVNRFLYDDRHVQALLLIRRLRDRHQPLEAIAAMLPDLLGGEEEAFRPEVWEKALEGAHLSEPVTDRLLAAATEAFVRCGYAEVTVADVSAAAGLAKGTVYRHFTSKEEMFLAVVSAAVDAVLAGFCAGAPEPVAPGRAASLLAPLLAPYLPMLLDVLAGALRGHTEHEATARAAVASLAAQVGERVTGAGDPSARGGTAFAAAVGMALGAALEG